ncbi:hypothetical protein Aple_006690 [Acrocarpospora pleiomorpha]|uniref:Uncharacterized protein n=1 Tax=Acrocarpospora pleiomorpha TaxID=90975 RepID=A0A5M3X9J3_9ACTN|nr:hypothetical protein [Acrocarpospora pleiomorpha]GES17774.1 hypothetical protein Aple_006690 [Acrocarpospora pleiomorpha]
MAHIPAGRDLTAFRLDATTRHLCAGTYLDREFRGNVLREVHNDSKHRIAPSYGFDLVPVVRHAWRAWVLETGQQVALLGLLAACFARNAPATIVVAGGLGFWGLARLTVRGAVKAREHRRPRRGEVTPGRTRLLRLGVTGCLLFALVPPVVAQAVRTPLGELGRTAGGMGILLAVVAGLAGGLRQQALNQTYWASSMRVRRGGPRLHEIDRQQRYPYVVYRRTGADKLFVGSGKLVHRWAMGVPLKRADALQPDETPHVRASALVARLKDVLEPLAELPGFELRDRLYVAEEDVLGDRDFLRIRPGQEEIDTVVDNPFGRVRHFLEITTHVAEEVVVTVFLRATVKARTLSLELVTCALTRTPPEFQQVEAYAENGPGAVVRAVARGVGELPGQVAGVWRLVAAPGLVIGAILAGRDRTLVPRRGGTIGTRRSVREDWASVPWADARLDETLIQDHLKIIERLLLTATEEFLASAGLDPVSFRRGAASIINNLGVLNMGGKIDMNQSAVGANARVHAGGTTFEE